MNTQDKKTVRPNTMDHEHYRSAMTRRESLKWFGLLAGSSALAVSAGCSTITNILHSDTGHWPTLDIPPIVANGYGKDPNLILPPASPWPLTLTTAQLNGVAVLCDLIVPREGETPSASEVNVPDVINEWISAPYDAQQKDRVTVLHALAWIDDEAHLRFDKHFVALKPQQQTAILDDIAWHNEKTAAPFQRIASAFNRVKNIVLAAYFCSPEGCKDIGYLGNIPIAGDYPGPSTEAKAHLDQVLAHLGLTEFAYHG